MQPLYIVNIRLIIWFVELRFYECCHSCYNVIWTIYIYCSNVTLNLKPKEIVYIDTYSNVYLVQLIMILASIWKGQKIYWVLEANLVTNSYLKLSPQLLYDCNPSDLQGKHSKECSFFRQTLNISIKFLNKCLIYQKKLTANKSLLKSNKIRNC